MNETRKCLSQKQNESIHLVIHTADIIKFRQSIGTKVRDLLQLTKYYYAELKLTVIADLVCFIKKRDRKDSGINRRDMIIQRSLASERAKTADNELVKLTKLEEKFAEVYTLLQLLEEGGKVVPVLVPPDTLKLFDIMIKNENLKTETYFFQKESRNLRYRSAEALNKFAKEFELYNKSLLRSTKLRKHMATAAQFFNLRQYQRTWDADFLRHDLRVHDKYYRMHTDAEIVTKLLYMVDSGKFEDVYSKDIDSIQLTLEDDELDDSADFTGFDALVLQMGLNKGAIF